MRLLFGFVQANRPWGHRCARFCGAIGQLGAILNYLLGEVTPSTYVRLVAWPIVLATVHSVPDCSGLGRQSRTPETLQSLKVFMQADSRKAQRDRHAHHRASYHDCRKKLRP